MTTEIERELYQLVEAVKHSKNCREYYRWRKVLESDPELFERVNVFRKAAYELQISEDDGTLEDRIEKYMAENAELTEEPRVRAFLDAELDLCRMLQTITDKVVRGIDFK